MRVVPVVADGSRELGGRRVLPLMSGPQQSCFLVTYHVRFLLARIFTSIRSILLVFTCHIAMQFLIRLAYSVC